MAHAIDARDKTGIYIVSDFHGRIHGLSMFAYCSESTVGPPEIPSKVCFIWGFVVFGAFIRSCRNQKRRRELEERRVEIITNWQVSNPKITITNDNAFLTDYLRRPLIADHLRDGNQVQEEPPFTNLIT